MSFGKQPEPNNRNPTNVYLCIAFGAFLVPLNDPLWCFFRHVCGVGSGGYRCQDECSNLAFKDDPGSSFFKVQKRWQTAEGTCAMMFVDGLGGVDGCTR